MVRNELLYREDKISVATVKPTKGDGEGTVEGTLEERREVCIVLTVGLAMN